MAVQLEQRVRLAGQLGQAVLDRGRPRHAGGRAPAQCGQQETRPPVGHAEVPLLGAVRDRREGAEFGPDVPQGVVT